MDKKNKIILASVLTTVPVVSIISTIATIAVLNNKKTIENTQKFDVSSILDNNNNNSTNNNNNNNSLGSSSNALLYMFNGQIYKDFNSIIKRYIEDYDPIKINKYIGDFSKAFNYSDKTLNINWLKEFNVDKILPAYKTASGLITEDFEKAKSSFLNKALTKIYYTDFNGNLFEEKSEAQQSMAKSKVATPIMFYELNDGTKINPLNKTDINYLKETSYKSIYNYLNSNNNLFDPNISVSLYDSFKDDNQNQMLSSKHSNNFYNNNSSIIENLIKEIFEAIYLGMREYLDNFLRFDVKLEVRNIRRLDFSKIEYNNALKYNEYNWWILTDYDFDKTINNFPNPIIDITNYRTNSNIEDIKKKLDKEGWLKIHEFMEWNSVFQYYDLNFNRNDSITFPNVSINELYQFDDFLDYEKMKNSKNFGFESLITKEYTIKPSYNLTAEICRISNFRGASFNLMFTSNLSHDIFHNASGVDFKPFSFGTHKNSPFGNGDYESSMTFDVVLNKSKDTNIGINEMFDFVQEKLDEKFMLKNDSKSLIAQISSLIKNLVKDNPKLFWNKLYELFINPDSSFRYTNNSDEFEMWKVNKEQFFSTKNILNINAKNQLWFDSNIENKFLDFNENSDPDNVAIFDGITFNYEPILSEEINKTTINNILEENKLRFVIEYNHNPLFMIDIDVSLIDKNKKYLTNTSLKSLLKNYFFKNENPTSEQLDKMINISQDFNGHAYAKGSDLQPNGTINYFNDVNLSTTRIQKLSDNTWKFNYKQDDNFIDSRYPDLPDSSSDKIEIEKNNDVKINQIVNVYNDILKNSSGNIKDLVDPKDVVFLFGKFDGKRSLPLSLKFRKFLSYGIGETPSLSSGKKIEFYDNIQDLEWAILNKTSVEPGKVVMLFDNDGNIVNPGVAITDEEEAWLTSDGVFGSKKVLYDNFLRTKIIRPIEDKVFYKASEASELELVVNQINKVYSFTVPDLNSSFGATITYYYLSYEDCFNNLVGYLRQMTKEIIIQN